VICYELYCQIRLLHQERGLNFAQIARELNLDEETVAKWARAKNYIPAAKTLRKSKLDPYKIIIQRWLERHSYTATQIFQRLRAEEGYTGGFTILTDYVRTVRRVACAGVPHLGLCSRRMRSSRLGLRRFDGCGLHQKATLLLCHGALLQPLLLPRV